MKLVLSIIFLLLSSNIFANIRQDSILNVLKNTIQQKSLYDTKKETRIVEIKNMLAVPNISERQMFDVNDRLYHEYKTFRPDSAIYYAKLNSEIVQKLEDPNLLLNVQLDLASIYVVSGMYLDALNLLNFIQQHQQLPKDLQIKYNQVKKQLYFFYSGSNAYASIYKSESDHYRDSLLQVLDRESNYYKIVFAEYLNDTDKLNEAKSILHSMYDTNDSYTHEKAVLAYSLASVFKKENNSDSLVYYLSIASICDLQNSIKENAAMNLLATTLYDAGDVNMAYLCIKSSMEDVMFSKAKQRTYEVSQIFPIIDSAYQTTLQKQKKNLLVFLMLVSILAILLVLAIAYVYRQMKRLSTMRKELSAINRKLKETNNELTSSVVQLNDLNQELSTVNQELTEANQIKEVYIGHFLDLCSTYIDKLEKFQNTLNKKAVEKKMDELYRMLKSKDMIDQELKELYENFDRIFLHLFPTFVDEFNSLLIPEERFVVKSKDMLNVELRIFALIRLGITDSSKIANFLHYSANTIYSYRTRVRNKSQVPRDEFEYYVMKIATSTPLILK